MVNFSAQGSLDAALLLGPSESKAMRCDLDLMAFWRTDVGVVPCPPPHSFNLRR